MKPTPKITEDTAASDFASAYQSKIFGAVGRFMRKAEAEARREAARGRTIQRHQGRRRKAEERGTR